MCVAGDPGVAVDLGVVGDPGFAIDLGFAVVGFVRYPGFTIFALWSGHTFGVVHFYF